MGLYPHSSAICSPLSPTLIHTLMLLFCTLHIQSTPPTFNINIDKHQAMPDPAICRPRATLERLYWLHHNMVVMMQHRATASVTVTNRYPHSNQLHCCHLLSVGPRYE